MVGDLELRDLANRAFDASQAGTPLEVTPEEWRAMQDMTFDWHGFDVILRAMWETALRNHQVIEGIPAGFTGLPVVVKGGRGGIENG